MKVVVCLSDEADEWQAKPVLAIEDQRSASQQVGAVVPMIEPITLGGGKTLFRFDNEQRGSSSSSRPRRLQPVSRSVVIVLQTAGRAARFQNR